MKSIKFISDLHLERRVFPLKFKKKQLGGDLFLAGDIGSPLQNSYWDFLKYTSDNFDNVYFTAGNHEYWNLKKYAIKDIDEIIYDKSINIPNIHYLNNDLIKTNDYNIIGSTLWSYPLNDFNNSLDFSMIYTSREKKLNYKSMRALHRNSVYNIENLLIRNKEPTILLTHYIPSFDFTKKKKRFKAFYSLFASNLDYLIDRPVYCWIFGHTHDKFITNRNGVKCCVNSSHSRKRVNVEKLNFDLHKI